MCMDFQMKIVLYYPEYISVTTTNMCFGYKFDLINFLELFLCTVSVHCYVYVYEILHLY